jgi:hypothetical protein
MSRHRLREVVFNLMTTAMCCLALSSLARTQYVAKQAGPEHV